MAVSVGIAGIAVAVAVMLLSVAITRGFQQEIRKKLSGFEAQITLTPLAYYYGDSQARITMGGQVAAVVHQVLESGGEDKCDYSASAVWTVPGVVKTPNDFLGVVFKAYGSGHDPSFEKENLVEGEWPQWSVSPTDSLKSLVVLSTTMAQKLSLSLGEKVDASFISSEGAIRTRRLKVVGLYDSHFSEYDDVTAYASPALLAPLSGVALLSPSGLELGQRVELRGLPPEQVQPSAEAMQGAFNAEYAAGRLEGAVAVDTVYRTAAGYFNWLGLLDANVVVILVLMGCVSGFTLVASIIILILERVRMIGLFKALGATQTQLRRIFSLLGLRVMAWGLILGNALGLGLILVQHLWHPLPLDPSTYYLTSVPVSIGWIEIVILDLGAVVLALLLLLLPTAMIARIAPAATLRWE